jgi:HPt (histidine-containing phosphotransfer) domain-containing protein
MTSPLEALERRFRQRCVNDLGVLQQWLRAPETVSASDLKTLVHQMSGAAGAFGYPALGALAMELDNQLLAGAPPSRERVQALIDELGQMEEK